MKRYISPVDTAKLVRQALKEAFKGVKFSVRVERTSLRISWIDGANESQVSAVVKRFAGSSFDGMADIKNSIYHRFGGEDVTLGTDYIFFHRENSVIAINRAIDQIFRLYDACAELRCIEKPSVADFKNGSLFYVHLFNNGGENLQSMIHQVMCKHTFFISSIRSETAEKMEIVGKDIYPTAPRVTPCKLSLVRCG